MPSALALVLYQKTDRHIIIILKKREVSRMADNNNKSKAMLTTTGDWHIDISQPEVETLQEESKCHLTRHEFKETDWVSANISA